MSHKYHSETAFETVVDAHLLNYGHMPVPREGFDRERVIFLKNVFAFVRNSAKGMVEAQGGPRAEPGTREPLRRRPVLKQKG